MIRQILPLVTGMVTLVGMWAAGSHRSWSWGLGIANQALRGQAGRCSLCGTTELPPRRRSWCSDDCVTMWNVASAGQAALAHLRAVHGSFCHCCGDPVSYLEVDHWRPLWSLTDEMRLELRWWLPFNLRLLCQSCHRSKTRHEAAVRAAVRRGDSEWTQWPGPGAEPPPPPRGARAAAAGQLRLV